MASALILPPCVFVRSLLRPLGAVGHPGCITACHPGRVKVELESINLV